MVPGHRARIGRTLIGIALLTLSLHFAPARALQQAPLAAASSDRTASDAAADSVVTPDSARVDTVVAQTATTAVVLAASDSMTVQADSMAAVEAHPQDSPEDRGLLIISADGKSSLRIRGSIRLNGAYDFNGLQSTETFDTFQIPTGAANKTEPRFFMSARQTRIGLEASRDSDRGEIFMRIEADFLGDPFLFRLRHAFGRLRHFTVGQTWSTFGDVASVPRTVDLDGPNSSVQVRTVQIRYSRQPRTWLRWAVGAESPEPEVNEPDSLGLEPAFQSFPDITARARTPHRWGHVQLAGVFRSIAVREPRQGDVDYLLGAGLLFSGRVDPGKRNEFLWQLVGGEGISRFVTALSGQNLDVVFNPNTMSWETLAEFGGYLSFGRHWSPRTVSYLTVGSTVIQNKEFQSDDAFSHSGYVSGNGFWDITQGMRVGVEYSWGIREDKGGATGTANRLSFIFYYDF
ncbi:MAG: hypothetical protein JSW67_02055 [Candidatus Latescibacterota bacterium]|nr:MAG: hypothetical protein JSW67_02055 [Candidatus Latescibacterota bacterium]